MPKRPYDPPPELSAGRIPDKHVSFLFEAAHMGGHVVVKVRAATRIPSVQVNHSRGLCGTLTMAPEEWALLREVLERPYEAGPLWLRDDGPGIARLTCVAAAGHPAFRGAEVDRHEQFIEIQDGADEWPWPDRHGWVVVRDDRAQAKCGGPGICTDCFREAREYERRMADRGC